MELSDAFEAALAGEAILFVGAGFSRDALNKDNQGLPVGGRLSSLIAERLGLALGEHELPPLEDLAQDYFSRSAHDLFELLVSRYTAKTLTEAQSSITCRPWRRIYTTNYDNVLELALGAAKRPYRSQTISDTPSASPPEHTDIVHLNGFIHRAMVDTLQADLRLTSVSYASAEISLSPWALAFRTDIRFSKAAIFIGYSLADLDITRLISAEPVFREKCVFVVSPNPSPRDSLRLPHYGRMVPSGIEQAAQILEATARRFRKPERLTMFYSFEERNVQTPTKLPTDDARFDLLLRGTLDLPMLARSVADFKRAPYVIPRDATNACLQHLTGGAPIQVIHSNLGNGKTVLAEALCVYAVEMRWRAFKLDRERPRLSEEVSYFLKTSEKTLLIIEHYPSHFDMLRDLLALKNPHLSLVLTARTSAHEIFADRLAEIAGGVTVIEHDLNRMSDNEIEDLNLLLDAAGYWRVLLPSNGGDRRRILKRKYHRELQAVLLGVIESPSIRDRIQTAYDELCKLPDLELFVVTAFLLDGVRFGKDAFLLGELIDRPTALADLMRRSAVVKEFITYRDGEFVSRSPILARFVLTSFETSGSVEVALRELFRRAASRRTVNCEIENLTARRMQYSQVESLFPKKAKSADVGKLLRGYKKHGVT